MLYEISQEVKDEIKKQYLGDNLVLLTGAGMSMPFQMGSWRELIERVADICEVDSYSYMKIQEELKLYKYNESVRILKDCIESKFPEEDAEYFLQCKIAQQIDERQQHLFSKSDAYKPYDKEFCPQVSPMEHNYLDIARYTGFRLMVTTNYDTILSEYTDSAAYSILDAPKVVKGGMQHIFLNNDKRYVFHLHGIYTRPESIILSEESYEQLYQNEGYKKLMQLFDGTKSMFCIGFSMNDSYFKNMMIEDIKKFRGRHYVMLAFDGEEARRKCREKIREFEEEDLIVIPYYPNYPDKSVTYAQAIRKALNDLFGIPVMNIYQKLEHWLEITKKYYGNYVLKKLYVELFHELQENNTGAVYEPISIGKETETSLLTYLRKMWKEGFNLPVLLKGCGGSGKTVAMQNTCQKLLEEKICAVYIPLCDFKSGTLEEYIRKKILYHPILSYENNLWNVLQKKCLMSSIGNPQVILFLDGVNEIAIGSENRISLRNDLKNWMCNHTSGVQLVFSSRNSLEEQEIYCEYRCLEVKPLDDTQIEEHLVKMRHPLPEKYGKLWELIRNPLMMSLYLYTEMFEKTYIDNELIFGNWLVCDSPSEFQIIYNFVLSQLYKNRRNFPDNLDFALWYYAVEYGAAKIGWELFQNSSFEAEDLQIVQWLENIESEMWESDNRMKRLLFKCHKKGGWKPDSYEQISVLYNILSLLCINGINKESETNDVGSYWGFMHQTMRDYFAARALWNDWMNKCLDKKARWCEKELNKDVLELLGSMINSNQWVAVWESKGEERKLKWEKSGSYGIEKTDYLELNLLKLSYYIEGISYDSVQFAWHDLRNIPLYRWEGIAKRKAIDFSGALVSRKTFFTLGHTSYIYLARFSPNGQYLLTVSADQTMILWDGHLLQPLFTYVEGEYDVDGISWNHDSNRFLSWGNDKRIVLWKVMENNEECIFEASDMLSGECVQWYGAQECIVYDSGKLLTVNFDGTLKMLATLDVAIRVSFSGNGNYLAVIKRDGFGIYDVKQADKPMIWKCCEGNETCNLVFAPNERDFIFYNNHILWLYRGGRWYSRKIEKIQDVKWSANGQYFYVSEKILKRYKLYNLKSVKNYKNIQNFNSLDVVSWGDSIFVSQGVGLYLYDEESGLQLRSYLGEDRRIYELNVNDDGTEVVISTRKKKKYWKKTKVGFQVISEEEQSVSLNKEKMLIKEKLEFVSMDGTKVLAYEGEWCISWINSSREKVYLRYNNDDLFEESLYVVQWSGTGNNIVGLDWAYNFYVWDANTGRVINTGVLNRKEIGLVESIILGKNIFFNTQEGNLWMIKQGVVSKIRNGYAFGYLKSFGDNAFLAKNCNYTTWQVFSSESGKKIEEMVSIEGINVLGALFDNSDLGRDLELKIWIESNGGVFS